MLLQHAPNHIAKTPVNKNIPLRGVIRAELTNAPTDIPHEEVESKTIQVKPVVVAEWTGFLEDNCCCIHWRLPVVYENQQCGIVRERSPEEIFSHRLKCIAENYGRCNPTERTLPSPCRSTPKDAHAKVDQLIYVEGLDLAPCIDIHMLIDENRGFRNKRVLQREWLILVRGYVCEHLFFTLVAQHLFAISAERMPAELIRNLLHFSMRHNNRVRVGKGLGHVHRIRATRYIVAVA
jgi:hypothetical protein